MNDHQQHGADDPIDPSLDVPANANTIKHVNYTAAEEAVNDRDKDGPSPRREEWERGLAEGREEGKHTEPLRSGQSDNTQPDNATAGIP